MSFVGEVKQGVAYAPGWFLANNEGCTRETKQFYLSTAITRASQLSVAPTDGYYIPMGAVYPSNDGNAIGIVYEDVDVSTGDMPGSVVTKGEIYADRLADTLAGSAKSALAAKGFTIIDQSPAVTRPEQF